MSNLDNTIKNFIATHQQLVIEANKVYVPIVRSIIETNTKNVQEIEHTLDRLLDFAFDNNILILFKRLCRHYFAIDPVATREYVYYYKEMWDGESES